MKNFIVRVFFFFYNLSIVTERMFVIMRISYSKSAVKAIERLSFSEKQLIKSKIDGLFRIPPEGDIKALKGMSIGIKRLRVGKYRVIFRIVEDEQDAVLEIIDIGSRGDIYK